MSDANYDKNDTSRIETAHNVASEQPIVGLRNDNDNGNVNVSNMHDPQGAPRNDSMDDDASHNHKAGQTRNVAAAVRGENDDIEEQQQSRTKSNSSRADFRASKISRETTTSRRSSLDLRRLPVNVLLTPTVPVFSEDDRDDDLLSNNTHAQTTDRDNAQPSSFVTRLLQRLCLNSQFTLQTQMMLSFGIISAVAIVCVVGTCMAVALVSGHVIDTKTQQTFGQLIQTLEGRTARYTAEDLTPRLLPHDVVQIVWETARDRFVHNNTVPFVDTVTQTHRYPMVMEPWLPLEGEWVSNVNESNYQEHVQSPTRWSLYGPQPNISTAHGVYWMPTKSNNRTNITNNDNINNNIRRMASDLIPLLKALYEYHVDVKQLGIFFRNAGVGSAVVFPGMPLQSTHESYVSVGCDWLKGPHPYNMSRTIVPVDEINTCLDLGNNSQVREAGMTILPQQLHPLDQAWCQQQVLGPDKILTHGPFLDQQQMWLLTVGRSVYDRITQELIGCIGIRIDLQHSVRAILANSTISRNSHLSVVRWNKNDNDESLPSSMKAGTVVASTAWNMSATSVVHVADLSVGVDHNDLDTLLGLVDYTAVWDPIQVRQIYEQFNIEKNGYQVTAYPIPTPPETYDEEYEPTFLVIVSVYQADVFVFANQVEEDVNRNVTNLIILSVAVGLAGFLIIIAVLFMVSHRITLPLRRMNEIAKRIIDNFGSHEDNNDDNDKIHVEEVIQTRRQLIKTELSEIVEEFRKMVLKFSGGEMAKAAKSQATEVENQFQLFDEFDELYSSRKDPSFKYCFTEIKSSPEDPLEDGAMSRLHCGSNIYSGDARTSTTSKQDVQNVESRGLSSPLFKWIVALIVIPLLVSTITISAVVTVRVSQELPIMVTDAERGLVKLQVAALIGFARLRAGSVSKASERSIRDNHVLTRYVSWLLFGAVKVGRAIPEMTADAEACKNYSDYLECPRSLENHICDCKWNDERGLCQHFQTDSRYLVKPYLIAYSQDLWPNGNRNTTSYPSVANSPTTTAWFETAQGVPGSPANWDEIMWAARNDTDTSVPSLVDDSFVPGSATTYTRLRSIAALPIFQPLYNYDINKENVLSTFIALEADGMYFGYSGCNTELHITASHWQSTQGNGGPKWRPDVCPEGKYGYDPRCRPWYAIGKNLTMTENSPLYVTPSYTFATQAFTAQTCTSPLVNPVTNEHVGQTLVDFISSSIFESLDPDNTPLATGGFPILLTMRPDENDADTVIGPGVSIQDESKPIEELVESLDDQCVDEGCGFAAVLSSMRAGEMGNGRFLMNVNGSNVTLHIAYAPVVAKTFRQINASDFSRGVELVEYELYSLALVEPEASMLKSFEQAEDEIHNIIRIGVGILCALIIVAAGLIVFLSHRITESITQPMAYLLELMHHINRAEVDEDIPGADFPYSYGSREVLYIRLTMERLYKIIQCANAAYFAGEVEVAYEVFTDALRLFIRLDNKKAIGVASNNLGNTMLTVYRTMESSGEETFCGMTKREIIEKGIAYFHQAIQLGEQAYDAFYEAEGWSPRCLHFMQHLSNRYFNRAMFLLTVKDGHEKPKEITELGLRDLEIVQNMDVEIVSEGAQVGWDVRTPEAQFEVLISRVRGHITLLEMGYSDDWEVEEMLDDAFKLVKQELGKEEASSSATSDLFLDVTPAGRMQQIEFELMRYKMVKEDVATAAKIAVRMLVEDEFTLAEAQKKAVDVLIRYCELVDTPTSSTARSKSEVRNQLKQYQDWLDIACDDLMDASSRATSEKDRMMSTLFQSSAFSKFTDPSSNVGSSMRKSSIPFRESHRGDIVMEAF